MLLRPLPSYPHNVIESFQPTPPDRGEGPQATFRSLSLQAQFQREGFVVLDAFEPDEVASLRASFEDLYVGETTDTCHRSNESLDLGYRRALHRLITGALDPIVRSELVDHRSFSSGTLVKWKGPNSAMPVHQDWTMVDETRYRAVSLWVPLCDVDQSNGALAVLPGSHHVLHGMRPNPGTPPSVIDPLGGVSPIELQSVEMRAGQCLVFDHGVGHGSPPNSCDEPRIALVLAAAPATATLQHLWRRPDDLIDRFEVADAEFFRHCTPGYRPDHDGITLVETLPFSGHDPQAHAWVRERLRPSPMSAL